MMMFHSYVSLPEGTIHKRTDEKGANAENICNLYQLTTWLFNIAMENHQF